MVVVTGRMKKVVLDAENTLLIEIILNPDSLHLARKIKAVEGKRTSISIWDLERVEEKIRGIVKEKRKGASTFGSYGESL